MIKIIEKQDGKYVQLSGDPSDVMLFYCLWQTKLWPNWMNHDNLDDKNDHARKQHYAVANALVENNPILLANDQKVFKEALKFAMDQCTKIGIYYAVYKMQLQMVNENLGHGNVN